MKKILIVLLVTIISVISYAKNDSVEKILKRGVLYVGTTSDYKPFTYIENGEHKGYDIEVAKPITTQISVSPLKYTAPGNPKSNQPLISLACADIAVTQ